MSGAAIPASAAGLPAAGPSRRAGAKLDPGAAQREIPLGFELVLFAALAAYGGAQWARLVDPSSVGRLALALAVACAGGVLLRAIAALKLGRAGTLGLAVVAAVVTVGAALVAAGLPIRLLAPAHWGEFQDDLRDGLGGIEAARLPYAGSDPWIRLTLVLGAPAMIAAASVAAFWPARNRARWRAIGLGLLLTTYGFAVTLDNPGAEILWGLPLLFGAVAWLWIARLRGRRRTIALAATLAAGVLALPLAVRLNGQAWWDYETWDWFGADRVVTFQWDHFYGPLNWPRDGTTMITVRSEHPLYWKASVLDRFDGFGWQRAETTDALAAPEVKARIEVPGRDLGRVHPEWLEDATFEFRGLSSDLVIGAGVPIAIQGLVGARPSTDGTITNPGGTIKPGDQYSIVAYAPQPSAEQLRDAPVATSARRFGGSTLLGIPKPHPGEPASRARGISMPLWGKSDQPIRHRMLVSPYAATYALARRWVADSRTPYDAVRSISDHLRSGYSYSQDVPNHTYPLTSFLFDDRAGYCQQFSGTMALMLRMVGIPSRVVSGFAPGSQDRTEGIFEVDDLDAHAWVEVYFRGIGWVTFDPTPAVAPAQSLSGDFQAAFRGAAPNPRIEPPAAGDPSGHAPALQATGPATAGQGDSWAPIGLAAGALIALVASTGPLLFWRRRRRLASGRQVDAQVAELHDAIQRLGWKLGPNTTLLAIERRFTGSRRVAVRRYAELLRRHRYAPGANPPPGPADRRALRRALSPSGLRGWLRGVIAIPPGGPARA